MREIKFRAWDGKHMRYGGFSVHATAGRILPLKGLSTVKEDSPVMQYTGLKDKNGKEVYEGDILCLVKNWRVLDERIYEVKYQGVSFRLFSKGDLIGTTVDFPRNLDAYWEVIGDIYENPELLEK